MRPRNLPRAIDIKLTEIKNVDTIVHAIERVEAAIRPERAKYVQPDCGLWMLKRKIPDGKIRVLVTGHDLFEGHSSVRALSPHYVSGKGRQNGRAG